MEKGLVLLHNELHDLWFDWLKDAVPDVIAIHPRGGARAVTTLDETIAYVQSSAGQNYLNRWRDLGVKIEFESHSARWMLKQSGFDQHPDWFRVDEKGNRNPDWNFCIANPEVLAAITDQAENLCKLLHSDTGKYYIWPDDARRLPCHCAACRALSESDQMLRFANAVLKGIRRVEPEAKLSYLAYLGTMDIPTQTEPEPGIFLEYAPMDRDFTHAIDDPDSAVNAEHLQKLDDLLRFFGKKDASALEYWLDNSMFSRWQHPAVKLPYRPELVRRDIAFYEAAGFEKITTFAGFLDAEYVERFGTPPVADYAGIS